MSWLKINNREKKSKEKTVEYAPPPPHPFLHWELKQQFPGYEVRQHIIVDACGGWSWEVYQIVGGRRKEEVLKRMPKAVLLGMINNCPTLI